MGIFDSIGGYTSKKKDQFTEYREKYDRYDDERLKKAYMQASGVKKMAIGTLLKERGY